MVTPRDRPLISLPPGRTMSFSDRFLLLMAASQLGFSVFDQFILGSWWPLWGYGVAVASICVALPPVPRARH